MRLGPIFIGSFFIIKNRFKKKQKTFASFVVTTITICYSIYIVRDTTNIKSKEQIIMLIKSAIERALKNKSKKTTVKENDVKYVIQQDVEFPNTYLVFLSHVSDTPCFVGVIAKSVEGNYYNFKRMISNQEVIFKQLFYIDELEEKLFC